MQIGFARTMTFALAAATIASNGFYLYYLVHHHMSRFWSGVNGPVGRTRHRADRRPQPRGRLRLLLVVIGA
jgi:hypothetical protein